MPARVVSAGGEIRLSSPLSLCTGRGVGGDGSLLRVFQPAVRELGLELEVHPTQESLNVGGQRGNAIVVDELDQRRLLVEKPLQLLERRVTSLEIGFSLQLLDHGGLLF